MLIDRESTAPIAEVSERRMIKAIEQCVEWADAVILSDYSKGVLSHAVCKAAVAAAGGKPVIVDPKGLPWDGYRGATVIKPNAKEAELFYGRPIDDEQDLENMGQKLGEQLADPKIHAALRRVPDLTVASLRCDGTLFTCGNGGSAAQATHVAGEFVGPFYDRERRPLRAIPLGFDPSSFTAIGNDFNYESVFARQLEALGRPGDVLWAFTTSGNSVNVLRAMEKAKAVGIRTVLFSNRDGGRARLIADQFLYTPEAPIHRVQELRLLYAHSLCEEIERQLR